LTPSPVGAAAPPHRRLFAPARIGWWIGVLFMVGSACFALASLPGAAARGNHVTVGATYFVGSLFFTAAALLQHLQTIRATGVPGALRRTETWATAVQLVGTVFFNITTGAALNDTLDTQEQIARVWAPDAIGSICFLVASYLALLVVRRDRHPGDAVDRRIAWLNMIGSVFFGISALTSYIVPDTGEIANAEATNLFTFLGAVCFFLGARLLAAQALAQTTREVPPPT
jgi:hypothetical protein